MLESQKRYQEGTILPDISSLESYVASYSISTQHHQAPAVKTLKDLLPLVNTDEASHLCFHFALFPRGYVDERSKL